MINNTSVFIREISETNISGYCSQITPLPACRRKGSRAGER